MIQGINKVNQNKLNTYYKVLKHIPTTVGEHAITSDYTIIFPYHTTITQHFFFV